MKKSSYVMIDGLVIPRRIEEEIDYLCSISPELKRNNLFLFLQEPVKSFGGMNSVEYMEKNEWNKNSVERIAMLLRFVFLNNISDGEES